eukprot:5276335-Pleurochrysis_carterae.AAC.2
MELHFWARVRGQTLAHGDTWRALALATYLAAVGEAEAVTLLKRERHAQHGVAADIKSAQTCVVRAYKADLARIRDWLWRELRTGFGAIWGWSGRELGAGVGAN